MQSMITKPELAVLAASVNAEALAKAAGISTKSVYRIRLQQANPSLETVAAIESAVAKLAKLAKLAKRKPRATARAAGA